MYRAINIIRGIFDNITIVMIILVALFTLLIDGSKLKDSNFTKEYKIVKIISYSYIVFGIIVFIFLRIV
ncbi:MAG: hypothetical protein GX320_08410 [Tissierellia bacterium]|nr:hypothetical protein [Tissierellia bacterium]